MPSNIRHSHRNTISFSRYAGYPLGGGHINPARSDDRLQEPLPVRS